MKEPGTCTCTCCTSIEPDAHVRHRVDGSVPEQVQVQAVTKSYSMPYFSVNSQFMEKPSTTRTGKVVLYLY